MMIRKIIAALVALFVASSICTACEKAAPAASNFERATLIYVVDGDTICVQTDSTQGPQKVRLIGVNAPESVASDEYLEATGQQNTQAGIDASEFVKGLLHEGDTIFLQYDVEREDRYGRTLAYVWLEQPNDPGDIAEVGTKMLNGILLSNGYAEIMTIRPNTAYESIFRAL